MSATELKEWMRRNDKTVVDIASALKIHPNTVSNFLKGKRVHRSTQAQLEAYVAQRNTAPPAKTAAG